MKQNFNLPQIYAKVEFELNDVFSYDSIHITFFDLNTLSFMTGFTRTTIINKVKDAQTKNENIVTFFHKKDKMQMYPYKLKYVFLRKKVYFFKVAESLECQYEKKVVTDSDLLRIWNK